jgi:hypothetical protein
VTYSICIYNKDVEESFSKVFAFEFIVKLDRVILKLFFETILCL